VRGRKKKPSIPLRMFFGDLMSILKSEKGDIVNLIKTRMELVEGGRLKLDTENVDFGVGKVKDWQMHEKESVKSEIGSKVEKIYMV
jgi:hypothetical protein